MKKKLLIMFLAGTMAISLSACGGSDDSKKDSKAKTEQTNDEKEQKEAAQSEEREAYSHEEQEVII